MTDIRYGLKYLYERGLLETPHTDLFDQTIANSFFNAAGKCENSVSVTQLFSGNCDPPVLFDADGVEKRFVDNVACHMCKSQKTRLLNQRNDFETLTYERNTRYTKQNWSEVNSTIKDKWQTLNPAEDSCRFACSSCLFLNNIQKVQMTMTADCDITTVAFAQDMRDSLETELTNLQREHAAALANIGYDTNDFRVGSLTDNIMSSITHDTNFDILTHFKNAALVFQTIRIEDGTNSIISDNNIQASHVGVIFQASQNIGVGRSLYSDNEEATIYEDKFDLELEISELKQRSIDAQNNLTNIFNESATQLMLVAIIVLILIIVIALAVYYFSSRSILR